MAYEETGANLTCQNEEILFIQERSQQKRAESTESGISCGQAEPEIGHGCDGVHFVWKKVVSVANSQSAYHDLVSYTISEQPILSMVTTMLDKFFEKITDGTNLILHSDQGWHYQYKQYQWMLREKGPRQSISRKENCLDNNAIKKFFELLKSDLLYL